MTFNIRNRPRIFNLMHRLNLISAFSQTSPAELECLAKYSAGRKTAVEIGTFMGVAAAIISRSISKDGRLYCVDPYDNGDSIRDVAIRHLKKQGQLEKIELIRAYSDEAVDQLPRAVDFFFVDGDHSFNGLAKDWQIVKNLLQVGGIACFHDTTMPVGQTCGAAEYFSKEIVSAQGFRHLVTVQSLNVIERIA